MFIATGRNSSSETWSSSWIQFVNLPDCEWFIQSDLLKSNFSNEVMGGLMHLARFVIGSTGIYDSVLIRQWPEK